MDFAAKLKIKESYSLLKNVFYAAYLPVRNYSNFPKGIKYCGFTYYPRSEDFKDPPYEPSKLFLVKRIKSMKGLNPKERQYLGFLNIDGPKKYLADISVVKNIPQVNAMLWKVKHLVDIKPITWKGELPKNCMGTHLRDTGELVISPKLEVTTAQLEATKALSANPKKLDRQYLKEYLRRKWETGLDGTA